MYASKIPIDDYRCKKETKLITVDEQTHAELVERNNQMGHNYRVHDLVAMVNFINQYDDILMCFGAHTHSNSPSITHMGIFKSPISFCDARDKYKSLSLILHGFGAQVAHHLLDKKFLVFNPVYSMRTILMKRIDEGDCVFSSDPNVAQALKKHFEDHHIEMLVEFKNLKPLYHHEDFLGGEMILIDLQKLEPFYKPPESLQLNGPKNNL